MLIYFIVTIIAGALISSIIFGMNLYTEVLVKRLKAVSWWLAIVIGFSRLFLQVSLWGGGLTLSFQLADKSMGSYYWLGYIFVLIWYLLIMALWYFWLIGNMRMKSLPYYRGRPSIEGMIKYSAQKRKMQREALGAVIYNLFLLFLYSLPFVFNQNTRSFVSWIWAGWI
jgi:hypothetical protein